MSECDIEKCQNETVATVFEMTKNSGITQSMGLCEKHSDLIFNGGLE